MLTLNGPQWALHKSDRLSPLGCCGSLVMALNHYITRRIDRWTPDTDPSDVAIWSTRLLAS